MKFDKDFTDLTMFNFGVVVVYNESMQINLPKTGYPLYDVFGYKIGFSYPRWFKNLFKIV